MPKTGVGQSARCCPMQHIGRLRCRFDTPQRKRIIPRQDCHTSWDVLKRSIPFKLIRTKISTSKALESDHASIKKKIMKEPVLNCDELWWPLGKTKGVVLTALGKDACLMEVAKSRDIPTLMNFLTYDGVIQDSYAGWMHIGTNRQMFWHTRFA